MMRLSSASSMTQFGLRQMSMSKYFGINIKGDMDQMGYGAQNFMKVLDEPIDKESADY